jgi:hypothetical protein
MSSDNKNVSNNILDGKNKDMLFYFNNKVYDLNDECFYNYEKKEDDNIITTGYDWNEPQKHELDTVNNILNTIFPDENERNYILMLLCSTLDGKMCEQFNILQGDGLNGKSVITNLLLNSLGNYGLHTIINCILTPKSIDEYINISNIENKRFVLISYEEPTKRKLCYDMIYRLVNHNPIEVRALYQMEKMIPNHTTFIFVCNNHKLFDPSYKKHPINENRILRKRKEHLIGEIEISYMKCKSKFVDDEKLVNTDKYIFKRNYDYSNIVSKDNYKCAFIQILIENYKKYKASGYNLDMPDSISKTTQAYCNLHK